MLDLPTAIITVLRPFEPVFSDRVWEWAKILLVGAILAPGKRTVTAALRVMGLSGEKLTDWARQMIRQVRRWLPDRALVVVVDSSYAVLELLATCVGLRQPVTVVTRLRLDAALYDPAPPRQPGQRGPGGTPPRKKGARQPSLAQRSDEPATPWQTVTVAWYGQLRRTVELVSDTAVWYHPGLPTVPLRWVLIRDRGPFGRGKFKTQALLCTDLTAPPTQIVEWFVLRWQLEVTFQEARAHLGIETQRQWSPLAILRTGCPLDPALFALFSLVTLFAHQLLHGQALPVRQAAWYHKTQPTFSDTLALVRQHLWPLSISYLSPPTPDMQLIPTALFQRLMDTLAFSP